ncbi:MAG: sugar transferase [Dissulfurispiraceae bacterium]
MKRSFDIFLSVILLIVLIIPSLLIALAIRLTSKGPIFYMSERVGRGNSIFKMYKFRTMLTDTPAVATHLLAKPEDHLTPIGALLRKTSLDELPQLLNIINGDMSFVGPRPALFNQDDLIRLRTDKEIHKLVPGLTGWAQINGRDELPIPIKVQYDEYYKTNKSFLFDLKILSGTILKVLRKEGVTH